MALGNVTPHAGLRASAAPRPCCLPPRRRRGPSSAAAAAPGLRLAAKTLQLRRRRLPTHRAAEAAATSPSAARQRPAGLPPSADGWRSVASAHHLVAANPSQAPEAALRLLVTVAHAVMQPKIPKAQVGSTVRLTEGPRAAESPHDVLGVPVRLRGPLLTAPARRNLVKLARCCMLRASTPLECAAPRQRTGERCA